MAVGIEYNCLGGEMFPTYYGSPFVFKQSSLGSSLEYFYNLSGLILNILVWSCFLFLIDKGIKKLYNTKGLKIAYKAFIGLLVIFSTMNVVIDSIMIGQGFDNNSNFWYWDMDKEAKEWGVNCVGHFVSFKK